MTWLMSDHGDDGDDVDDDDGGNHGNHDNHGDDDGGVGDHLNDHPPSSRSTRPTTTFGVIFAISRQHDCFLLEYSSYLFPIKSTW